MFKLIKMTILSIKSVKISDRKYCLVMLIAIVLMLCNTSCGRSPKTQVMVPLNKVDYSARNIRVESDNILNIQTDFSAPTYELDIPAIVEKSSVDTLIKSYHFIPLETTEESMIGNISKLFAFHGTIAVLDFRQKKAFLFDKNGKFKCTLGHIGRGPGEYLSISDLSVDTEGNRIVLLDGESNKLQYYSPDGDFLEERSTYWYFDNLEFDGSNLVMNTRRANPPGTLFYRYQIVVSDSLQIPLARGFLETEDAQSNFYFEPTLIHSPRGIFCDDLLSDTLWRIRGTLRIPFAVVRKDGLPTFSEDEIKHISSKLYHQRTIEHDHAGNYCISNNYLYMNIKGNKQHFGGPDAVTGLLYSLNSKQQKRFGCQRTNNSRLGDFLFYSYFNFFFEGDSFCNVIQPNDILDVAQYDDVQNVMTPEEKSMVKALTPESNPVLMIMEPVDF